MKFRDSSLAFMMGFLLLAPLCVAQQNPIDKSRSDKSNESIIKLAATLVQIPVVVSKSGGRYVTDLSKHDFSIFEDGVRQEIEFFGSIDEPFHVALMIDSSGSTVEQLQNIKDSAMAFIRKLKVNDKVMVISFHDSVQIHCELTDDHSLLERAIRSIRPGEYTQIYEAVYTAVWERLNQVIGRKAVIIFTDGIDTASSEITLADTLDAVVESEDVLIYPIRFNTRPDVERRIRNKMSNPLTIEARILDGERKKLDHLYQEADSYLFDLAMLSGGIVERADNINDLDNAFSKIAEELRHQYLLGYYPSSNQNHSNDVVRKIKVTVSRDGLKVRVRPSYLSTKGSGN